MTPKARSLKSGKPGSKSAQKIKWELRLYVAGQTPRSLAAFANLKRICDQHLAGQYHVDVVDLVKHPELASRDQILAIPTVVRTLPPPLRKVIGDFSKLDLALVGLDLGGAK